MDTKRDISEIETALARNSQFDFTKNIVVFNVKGSSEKLPIYHECDMLVLSKSGYLTEIEIKRSWNDFLADFKKKHNHHNFPIVKYFYYCVPVSIFEKVRDKLEKTYNEKNKSDGFDYTGIISYDEDLNLTFYGRRVKWFDSGNVEPTYYSIFPSMIGYKRLFLEQRLELARLGAMRIVTLKEKIIKLKNEHH